MITISALSVYCGSRFGDHPAYRAVVEELGTLLAARGIRLVYGGGDIGLMGVLADAVLAGGGEVTGVIPEFLVEHGVEKRDVTDLIVVESMHARKTRMFDLADGCVVLPGGLGTLDEAIEIITWKQLRLHDKPVVVSISTGFGSPLWPWWKRSSLAALLTRLSATYSPWSMVSTKSCHLWRRRRISIQRFSPAIFEAPSAVGHAILVIASLPHYSFIYRIRWWPVRARSDIK